MFRKLFRKINIFPQYSKYGVSIWQSPQFLFLLMGIVIVVTTILTYYIGNRYIEDPLLLSLIIILLTIFLLIVSFLVTRSFERLAQVARIKSEFVSIVSHHLRSPLSNLRWITELLISEKLGNSEKKKTKYFGIIEKNVQRMTKLLKDMLLLSRIESEDFALNKQKVSLEKTLKSVTSEFKGEFRDLNIDLKLEISDNLPQLLIDRSKIKQVFRNLIDNAIHYKKKSKKGIIKIRLEKRKKKIYFKIEDNGVGIPKEEQRYIFKKFFRSKNARKYQTSGSGLGLYISKEIIEKSRGKIGFRSQKGRGSAFWFYLPIK